MYIANNEKMNLFEIEKDDLHAKFSDFFTFQAILGFGSFGVVVSAIAKSNNEECAVKIIPKKNLNPEEYDRLRDEAYILASLKHPNIVRFKEIKETDTKILIAMELVHGGHLKSLMNEFKQRNEWFSENDIALIMKTLLSAVEYIHNKNIVHRDIKPENILIENKNDFTTLKIADFGLSAQFGRSNMSKIMTQQCGTIIFMAPEQLSNKIYSKPVDVWSCGILMYMLLAKGDHPLYRPDDNINKFLAKLHKCPLSIPSNIPISQLARNLFQKLVHPDPAERYTADKALNHPWITGNFNDQVPLTTNEMFQSFEKEQNFLKIIKTIYFIGSCLQANNSLTVPPKYRELLMKKEGKSRTKEFSVEKNYIESIFNLSEPYKSPPKNPKKGSEVNTIKISHFITQKITPLVKKPSKHSNYTEKNDEIIASHSSLDENPLFHENLRQKTHTPNDSKETNTTLNSTQRPGSNAAADFIVKTQNTKLLVLPKTEQKRNQEKKSKSKRATSASLKNKLRKIKEFNPGNQEEIVRKPTLIKLPDQKRSIDLPKNPSVKTLALGNNNPNPKRHSSINPFENVKSKIFSNPLGIIPPPKIKSETVISSPLPNIRTPLGHKTEIIRKDVSIIKPNGKCISQNEYVVKKPITLTLNPPNAVNKRIRFRKKLV